jgi:hypothetical protein
MANRLKTLFFILVLSVSVFSGTPLQGGDMKMKNKVCPMKCCKKKISKSDKPKNADARYLCRVLICSQNMPINTATVSQVNLAPVVIASEKITIFEILFSTTPKEDQKITFTNSIKPQKTLPKYIQHQRILI